MTLVRCDPRRYANVHNQIRRYFDTFRPVLSGSPEPRSWRPAADVTEGENGWSIEMDLPGVRRENVKVSVDKGTLTIQGEKPAVGAEGETSQRRSERAYGVFKRQFTLPETVDVESVTAEHKDGVLRLVLPKSEAAKPKEIEVSVN